MPTARISERTHDFLRRQSEKTGVSIPVCLERLLATELGGMELESGLRGEVAELSEWQKKIDRALVSVSKRLAVLEGRDVGAKEGKEKGWSYDPLGWEDDEDEGRDVKSEDVKSEVYKKEGGLLDFLFGEDDEDGNGGEEKDDGWF